MTLNKANLRDLIAATGLVILLELDSNRQFFNLCDLEIWWMTSKNYRAHLLSNIKLCASFHHHMWIQTWVTIRKRLSWFLPLWPWPLKHPIWVKIDDFFTRMTLKFDRWPWETCTVGQGQSHCASNDISNSHPFYSQWIDPPNPNLRYSDFKIWPWKSKVDVMGEVKICSHNVNPTIYRLTSLLFLVNRPSHSWDTIFFKIWPWKSKVKVMCEVNVESHNLSPTFYRLTSLSFHVNKPSHTSTELIQIRGFDWQYTAGAPEFNSLEQRLYKYKEWFSRKLTGFCPIYDLLDAGVEAKIFSVKFLMLLDDLSV